MKSIRSKKTPIAAVVETLENRQLFSGGDLVRGGIVDGTIQQVGQQDSWTFNGQNGDTIRIGMTSTPLVNGYRSYAELYRPGATPDTLGGVVKKFFATGAQELTLDSAGTFTLIVHDYGDQRTGQYTISMEGVNPISPDPTPLVLGGIVSGHIGQALDVKEFTLDLPANSTITVGMTSTVGTSGFRAYGELFAPGSGVASAKFFARGQEAITLTEAGTYMLLVHDYSYSATGDFTIGVEGINQISPAPLPLVLGGIVGGKIDSPRMPRSHWG